MAAHARLRGRNPREGRRFDGRVAVTAVDAVVAYMMFVAEGNGLGFRDRDIGNEVARVDPIGGPDHAAQKEHCAYDAHFREAVCAAMEDLRH